MAAGLRQCAEAGGPTSHRRAELGQVHQRGELHHPEARTRGAGARTTSTTAPGCATPRRWRPPWPPSATGAMSNTIEDIGRRPSLLVIGSNTTECHPIIGRRIKQTVRLRRRAADCRRPASDRACGDRRNAPVITGPAATWSFSNGLMHISAKGPVRRRLHLRAAARTSSRSSIHWMP